MKRRTTVISAIAAVALLGAGTATAVAVSDDDQPSRSTVRVTDDGVSDARENANEAKGAKIKAEDAIAAALKHTSGVAAGADLDSDDGRLVWDVDVIGSGSTWHHVEVDPGTGKVLGSHVEKADDDGDGDDAAEAARVADALKNASTSASDAARAGAAKGTVTSVDADDDGSVRVWEVETTSADGTQHDWHVDLRSGAVTADRSSDDHGDDD
ncbi:PepSY domain-containing protein [Streptomyces longispororuber]|uniref:PepSY domain-containing protein n=1 Tax=Streptomyces longispororuber TaxID=68230 RepID=UPI00210BAFB8|nr:PepSY domain-containing protein [Streptomyces longispororuber]MCQ4209296.1 PepSY domain-containing protein [Streptomyces longispororuber]